jgi:hypothetical protein
MIGMQRGPTTYIVYRDQQQNTALLHFSEDPSEYDLCEELNNDVK